MISIVDAALNGLLIGIFFALMAAGFSMVWAGMRIVNVAHAALIVLAGYLAFTITRVLPLDIFTMVVIIGPLMFVVGVILYRFVISYAYLADSFETVSIVATFGLAIVIENITLWQFGPDYVAYSSSYAGRIELWEFTIPQLNLLAAGITLAALTGLYWLLYRTKTGRAVRASWQDESLAVLHGIDLERTRAIIFGVSVALAGVAGVLLPAMLTIQPGIHWRYIIIVFLIVVIGGIGNLIGTVIAGMLVGVIYGAAPLFMSNAWVPVILYLLLIGVLLFKPTGLFKSSVKGVK